MNLEQIIGTVGMGYILITITIWFISTCAFGYIMKHFIREAIKEAYDDIQEQKRKQMR